MNTPQSHGAIADGSTDCTDSLQAWLDAAGELSLPAGRYLYTRTLNPRSDTRIQGEGRHSSILYSPRAHSRMFAMDAGNIIFADVGFEGDPNVELGLSCFDWIDCDGITFDRCRFSGHRGSVVILSQCRGVSVTDTVFDQWGYLTPYGDEDAWWGGVALFSWGDNRDVSVRRSLFRDGTGHGMWFDGAGRRATVEDCVVDGCHEAALVGLPPGSVIRRNKWWHVRRKGPSGHGAELSGDPSSSDWDYIGNESFDCDGAGHYFTDVSHCRIEDNRTAKCNQGDPGALPQSGAYTFRTVSADPAGASHGVTYRRNTATPDRSDHACSFVNHSGNPASVITDFDAGDNDCGTNKDWHAGMVGLYGKPFAKADAVKGLAIDNGGNK